VVLGVDEHDFLLIELLPDLLAIFKSQFQDSKQRHAMDIHVEVFKQLELDQLPLGPMCWMWNQLAEVAFRVFSPNAIVLIGKVHVIEPLSALQIANAAILKNVYWRRGILFPASSLFIVKPVLAM
jgi:hypothetical protein